MNRNVKNMFEMENRQREAKRRLKEKQSNFVNSGKKMVVVGATTLVLAGAFSCSQASAYDRYDDQQYRGVGYMCFSDEVGSNGNGGYVSKGRGDYGGISYGLYQFATTTGSADDFIDWTKDNSPEVYKIFKEAGNPNAGTSAFGTAWKKAYKELEGKFEDAQTEFAMSKLVKPAYENVKDEIGIDLKKSRAREEFLVSTSVQFGPGGIVTLFKEVQDKGVKLSDDMDDQELMSIMCQHKYDTVNYHFRSSDSDTRYAARLRFKREKKELVKIAKEEAGPKLDEIDTNKEQTEATKTETSSSKTSKKEVVNDTADKYQGKGITYDFGEKNYKSGSLDCSGLISQMMNDMGVKVDAGNTNALKFSMDSKKISKDEVQPGDLVFWNDDAGTRHNKVYHIGMYIGNDTIVDCSPTHNGVGTRKLSECKDTNDMHYTYGRYTKLESKMKDYAQKIVESIDEFDDVVTIDNEEIEKDYEKVEEKVQEIKDEINENAKEETEVKEEKDTENETSEETKPSDEGKIENEDNQPSLEESEDASETHDEFESIVEEDKNDNSKDVKQEEETTTTTDDSVLDNTLIVGDSHAKALEDKVKDNDNTEVEATVGASAYVYLNDTNYFGDKLIDKLPENNDKIDKVIISLGVNNIEGKTNKDDIKKVIDKIEKMYPDKDIYFMKVNHVGSKYDGDTEKTNNLIDELNEEISDYVKDKDKVNMIDASEGLEKDGQLSKTNDGLHVNDNDILIDNLEKGIEDNQKRNETSLEESEDASETHDEFESIVEEDKNDNSKENKQIDNNQQEEKYNEVKEEQQPVEDNVEKDKNDESKEVEPVKENKEETKVEDNTNDYKESNEVKEEQPVEDNKEKTDEVEKEQPVEQVEEKTSGTDNQQEEQPVEETTTEDNSNSTDTKTEELHSRLQNNLFGRILLG